MNDARDNPAIIRIMSTAFMVRQKELNSSPPTACKPNKCNIDAPKSPQEISG